MLRTLLIDNYDSFTFNLFQFIAEANGCEPIVIYNNEKTWEQVQQLQFDNIVISPGPGSPDRPADFGVCADALLKATCPVFGVCLGHQGMAHYHGGKVEHAPCGPMHGRKRLVHHDGKGLFENLPNPMEVVRYHSLAVTRMPEGFIPTAWTEDKILMGLRHATRPLHGVQFHPESICTQAGKQLIANFGKITNEFLGRPHTNGNANGNGRTMVSVPGNVASTIKPRTTLKVNAKQLDFVPDPELAFTKLYGASTNAFWLDSARHEPGLARFSYMGDDKGPGAHILRYWTAQNQLSICYSDGEEKISNESILDYLDRELPSLTAKSDVELPFEFTGGYVGHLGYELMTAAHPDSHVSGVPDAILIHADRFIVWDHQDNKVWLVACAPETERATADKWISETEATLKALPKEIPLPGPLSNPAIRLSLRHQPAAYLAMIDRCLSYMRDGESYEMCLTNQLSAHVQVDPLHFYRVLRKTNPAPYAAFFRFPEAAVASSSPECFLSIDKDRVVESKPIKGTARRQADPEADKRVKDALGSDEKTQAENLMIVDLLRNDLGRVCDVGSVHVPKLMGIESYTTVHQMVSTIAGRLRQDRSVIDAIRASFPGGSMTGAPKVRTMELLAPMERGPRGVYSGAIGFFSHSGVCRLNIVIRTAVIRPGIVTMGAGGAIVALSDPQEELEETFVKWEPLLRALATTTGQKTESVLETLWKQGGRITKAPNAGSATAATPIAAS